LKKAILYQTLENNRVRCQLCYRRCVIDPEERGFCRTRLNLGGDLYTLTYGAISYINPTAIEDKPFSNFFPGTKCLSIGSFGCNFRCLGCQNDHLSWRTEELDKLANWAICLQPQERNEANFNGPGLKIMSSENVIQEALDQGCAGIAFTYNEPIVWLEYVLDTATLAKEKGLYTVYVTNSYLTPEHLEVIGPHIDAMALDIKCLDDDYYAVYCNVAGAVKHVLAACDEAANRYNIYVETRTCVIPGANDNPQMLYQIADWIQRHLGEDSVWHLLQFQPRHLLSHLPATPTQVLRDGQEMGWRAGLKHVGVVLDKGCD
jgi:pyruvate formate lyase activating enzyme